MKSRNDLVQKIVRQISNNTCSMPVVLSPLEEENGIFLKELEKNIESSNRKVLIMPINTVQEFQNEPQIYTDILNYIKNNGYLLNITGEEELIKAASKNIFWKNIKPYLDIDNIESIVFLLTGVTTKDHSLVEIFDLYSNFRKFCTEWKDSQLSVHFISIGNWEPIQLENLFKKNQTSWPFVKDYNLFILPDLTEAEVFEALSYKSFSQSPKLIHAEYLWELTNGDPWCVSQIMLTLKSISCGEIFDNCIKMSQSEEFSSEMKAKIQNLSVTAKKYLGNLLLGMRISCNGHIEATNELILSGLCRLIRRNETDLIEIKNWVIECAIRGKGDFYQEEGLPCIYKDFNQLIPPITCLNREAYNYICEIENLLRNQVILRLFENQKDKGNHPLVGITTNQSASYSDNISEDMFTRSSKWYKDRVKMSKYVDTHTALIGFTGLPNLIEIIKKLIREKDPVIIKLKPFLENFNALKDIRDAIAHNQLISEKSYQLVVNLRDNLIYIFCLDL
jgi:hypothetical protein